MRELRTLLIVLIALAALLAANRSSAGELDQEIARADYAISAYDAALAEYEDARRRFSEVVDAVNALKSGAGNLDGPALRSALRDAHAAADALRPHYVALSTRSIEVEAATRALLDAAWARMRDLESQVVSARPQDRAAMIAALNETGSIIAAYDRPVVEVDPIALDEIVSGLEETPEELRAAADELSDVERRLRRQLEELDQRIAEVAVQERLEARAREFAVQEAFFDDNDGVRVRGPRNSGGNAAVSGAADEGSVVGGDGGDTAMAGGGEADRGQETPGAQESPDGGDRTPEDTPNEAPDQRPGFHDGDDQEPGDFGNETPPDEGSGGESEQDPVIIVDTVDPTQGPTEVTAPERSGDRATLVDENAADRAADDDGRRSAGSARGRRQQLEASRAALRRELEAVAAERATLLRRAGALDD